MKLRFLGEMTSQKRTSGCKSCGNYSLQSAGMTRNPRKTIILDSLTKLDVRVGGIYEVTIEDGQGLLELTTTVNGNTYQMFEVV